MKLRNKLDPGFRLPSLRALVWLGFGLTAGILLLAVMFALSSVGEITRLGRDTAYNVFQITRQSRTLLETQTDLERSLKQYLVLDDPELFTVYQSKHKEFMTKLQEFSKLSSNKKILDLQKQLEVTELQIYRNMISSDLSIGQKRDELEAFKQLATLASQLLRASTIHVGIKASRLDEESQRIIGSTIELTLLLLSVSVIVVLVSVYLIVRPIRQLDTAIRSLGSGNFDHITAVIGPRDLEYLGKRLDWLRQRLQNLEESKQRFFRDVSHELKTPLATIHEGVELLSDEVVGNLNVEQKDITSILLKSSTKLEKLIEDILSFNRIQSDENRSKREKINLSRLVSSVVEEYQINVKNNRLSMDLNLEDVEMYGNPDNMRIVLDNLLSNAIKYSPHGGRIRISLTRRDDHAELEVEDQGPGIVREERDKVFNRFYQGKASRDLGVKGSGLGLSIASESIIAHHGHIEVRDARSSESGALLRVVVPVDFRH